jgi:hypothetical protein
MQDRALSYVQMSRSRAQTRLYTERAEVVDTVAELSKTMRRSRQKELAQDLVAEQQKQGRETERTAMR